MIFKKFQIRIGTPLAIIINCMLFLSFTFSMKAQKNLSIIKDEFIDINKGPVFTEQEVVDMALQYNRKLKSYETNLKIAEYRYESSDVIQNPELRIRDVSTKYFDDEFDELEVGLRWPLPRLGEMGEEEQEAMVNLWERKVRKIRYHQQLVARIRRNYATVLMNDQKAELAHKRMLKENERINIIEHLVKLGNRSIVYFTKAKMWYAEAKNDYTRAIQKQSLIRRELSNRSGIPEHAKFIMTDLPEIEQNIDELVELAVANRPEIELVQQRIELAEKQNNYESMKRIPWPTFVEFSYHAEKYKKENWGEFKMGIRLPLFNWNTGNIKATDLAVKKKQGESDAIRESIEDEVRLAYTVYKDLLLDWKNFQVYSDELISNAQSVVDQAKQHKTLMPDEVMEMELTIIDTEELLSEKRRDLAHALFDLYYAIGVENNEQLK
ncbi:TolC family protein [Bacteroidota bacterium]